ncbi:MAG: hypothetical protein KC415_01630 [Anaerolineales bacterium]|nr:hypothetical protein [Anaerolineales bacterium]
MNKARHIFKIIALILTLILAVGLFSGCQSKAGESTAVSNEPAATEITPSPADTATQIAENPTEDPADLPEEEIAPVDECLNCHIDKEMLIQTANPEEEVISENEGEG